MAEFYSIPYVVFDEFGLRETRCMKCGTPVATRGFVKVGGQNVLAMRRLGNWKRVRIELNNGTFAQAILCPECETNADPEKIVEQIKKGWLIEMRASGNTEEKIQEHMNSVESLAVRSE